LKQLIINADDFGYTSGVNRAIVEAHRNGIVSSTSLMANGAAFQEAVTLALAAPTLDVGCHLNVCEGRPLCPAGQVAHLVDAQGKFRPARRLACRLVAGLVPQAELEREFAAQLERLLAFGIRPTHLDTHQHSHLHPAVARALARTAQRYGIAWVRRLFEQNQHPRTLGPWKRRALAAASRLFQRQFDRLIAASGLRTPDFFAGFVFTGRLTADTLRQTLDLLPNGTTELVCHPGYCDADLAASPTMLQQQRDVERRTLCDPAAGAWLADRGIVLTSFARLAVSQPTRGPRPTPAVAGTLISG
jgi:hopanoid biosynthesis associated protein HpnK